MIVFPVLGFIIYLIFLLFYIIFVWKKKILIDNLINVIFVIYVLMLISVCFFPLPVQRAAMHVECQLKGNIIPFASIKDILHNNPKSVIMRQIGGNAILLLPFGVYLPLMVKNIKKYYYLLTFIISALSIEVIQFIICRIINYNYRAVDIDDVILNVFGAVVGMVLSYLFFKPIYNFITCVNEN